MKTRKINYVLEIKNYIMITLGLIVFTLGWKVFLIPNEITGGGIAGVDTILSTFLHIKQGYFLMGINLLLLAIGIRVLGFGFGIKTVYGAVAISLLFRFIPAGIFPVQVERFAACLMGGAISGVGLSLVFSVGGSTGGTDIIAMIVNKYFRSLSLGRVVLYCDIVIIGSSYFLYHNIEAVVYGYCAMLVLAITLDGILNGIRQSVQFFIFSNNYEELTQRIRDEVRRGCTIIDATGGHSGAPVKIVMVVVKKNQSSQVFSIVNQVDPKAFVSQGSVSGVYGEGFMSIN